MEEEVGIKVTRLRRRLSIEADDVKSPSTQSTPTKKRGGRLAAKPQLELIAENAPETAPKRTRKSTVKEVAEPVEEKAVTPSRRSTRIKSNTSIVSETTGDVAEDKGTPSRRTTRLKSNTSLIAEPVNLNSPRAKRAARRTSQVGSDNEAPITPARTTRRTRNNSTSSIDKPVEPIAGKLGVEIKEVIVEESENNVNDTKTTERSKNDSPSLRKSPRVVGKPGRKSYSLDSDNKENVPRSDKEASEEPAAADKSLSEPKLSTTEATTSVVDQKASEQINLSVASKNLIQEIEEVPKKAKSIFNKSTTAVEEEQIKTKRNRTKSWTTVSVESPQESSFCSDSEATKKRNKKKNNTLNFSNISGSGDGIMNVSSTNDEADKEQDNVSLNSSTLSNKKKKKRHEMSMTVEVETSVHEVSNTSVKESATKVTVAKDASKDVNEEGNNLNSSIKLDTTGTQKLFEQAPSGIVQSLVFIEDSDSNQGKENNDTKFDSGDQCVPVVDHQLVDDDTKNPKINLSYEPMDIDETMPENVSLSNFVDKNDSASEKRKSVLNMSQVKNDSINKSKRKSGILDSALETNIDEASTKSPRKSSITEMINDLDSNKSKRNSSITNEVSEDTTDGIINVSTRKSIVVDTENHDESINKKANKSKRKSYISNVTEQNMDEDSNNSARKSLNANNKSFDEIMNKKANKSKRKSSTSNVLTEQNMDEDSNNSARKSLNANNKSFDEIMNENDNKSKRKSTISNVLTEQNMDEDSNNSARKSLNADNKSFDEMMNENANKSKRKCSISNVVTKQNMDEYSNNSARKSLNADNKSFDEIMNKESNKSKRKSSLSNVIPDQNTNETTNKSTRKSSVSDLADDENIETSLNKSKRKSSVATMVVEVSTDKINTLILADDEDMKNKSSNKSKRKSSISNTNNDSMDKNDKSKNKSALYLDKTENNENKSTFVLSQLKDVSQNEINAESNAAKDSKDSNEQLSKSVNVPNVNTGKETDKKNLSQVYSTSTPLQQKSMAKLGLQINSSIIAPNSANKIEKKDTVNKSKKEASIMLEEDDSDSSEEEEDSEEESSLKKSKLIDDEAEEASDDYESGDSRDEEEREYEEINEIREKGETLDSDEAEFSDDSDYEKDSFIVSSDEEDEDLLSGSGDDLSMSADELTMTAKSKKKFNERKIKEQKKASREMYEARHKLDESDKSEKSPKSKKNNRQRFDTSSSEEDEEVTAQPKKNRRQRIDSSHDASALQLDTNKSLSKKKKSKRLSESVGDEHETNEKEITIRYENQADKIDPLTLLNVIKEEPKTPQKEFNISTVAVTNMDEVEIVNVDENLSIVKLNQTSDPLQATIAENDEDDITDEGSISENEEITQNYESVLSNLNKSGSKKIKSSNISLDLNKKTKQAKEPIVDQLNLTQVKNSKKNKANATENGAETKKQDKSLNKSTEKVGKQDNIFSEGSSDSIDMKLLFPEDSNDSEVLIISKTQTVKETTLNEDDEESPGNFIPLKRSLGKTNILENMNIANKSKDESILNVSGKKKNKRKSFQSQETLEIGTPEDDNLGFFIDTTGTLPVENKTDANTSIKNSAKKNKQKKNVSFSGREEIPLDEDSNDAPLEVSYRSEKNKSKQDLNTTQNNEGTVEVSAAIGTANQSAKNKKKNKKGLNSSLNVAVISMIETTDDIPEKSINTSVTNVEGSAKKNKKGLSESQIAQETENETPAEPILNISLGSAKKQKQKTISESIAVETVNVNKDNEDVMNQELVTKKRKRRSSANHTIEEIIIKDDVKLTNDESLSTKNQKKKRKISNNEDIKIQVEDAVTKAQEQETTPVENKNKSKVQHQKVNEIDEGVTKKNKKRKERDDDDACKISKVLKQNSFDKVHVPRLPSSILKQLDDKPKTDVVDAKKTRIISTSEFVVEETKRRRTKPSNYLEESVYCINDDMDEKKQKRSIKNPKVLPFIPTASTSDSGFTTNFRVNVISQQTKFVAQSSDVSNFKNDYLLKKRIKKLGTFEMYKRQRNIKIAKF